MALLGGATGRVGDPSGRSTERPVLSEEEIEHNVQCRLSHRNQGTRSIMGKNSRSTGVKSALICRVSSSCSYSLTAARPPHPTAIGRLLVNILQRNTRSSVPSEAGGVLPDVRVVNNLDWFKSISFLSFLRDVGKFARVGTMLAKDSVRAGARGIEWLRPSSHRA